MSTPANELIALQAQNLIDAEQVRRLLPLCEAFEAALKALQGAGADNQAASTAELIAAEHAYTVALTVELVRSKS